MRKKLSTVLCAIVLTFSLVGSSFAASLPADSTDELTATDFIEENFTEGDFIEEDFTEDDYAAVEEYLFEDDGEVPSEEEDVLAGTGIDTGAEESGITEDSEPEAPAQEAAASEADAVKNWPEDYDSLPTGTDIVSDKSTHYNILIVGNSFSVDTTEYIPRILLNAGYSNVTIANAYHNGVGADAFLNSLRKNTGYFTYRVGNKTGGWKGEQEDQKLSKILAGTEWDAIVFQHASKSEGSAEDFYTEDGDNILSLLALYARRLCPNEDVKIGYNMTWAYDKNNKEDKFKPFGYDQDNMFRQITEVTRTNIVSAEYASGYEAAMSLAGSSYAGLLYDGTAAAEEGDTVTYAPGFDFICPTGTAVQNARTAYGDSFSRDTRHLSYDYGRYLAGMTMVQALGMDLSELSDAGNVTSNKNTIITTLTTDFFYRCAADAVADPYQVTSEAGEELSAPELTVDLVSVSKAAVISWNAVPGATSYVLKKHIVSSKEYTGLKTVTVKAGDTAYTYTDKSLAAGQTTEYVLTVKSDTFHKNVTSYGRGSRLNNISNVLLKGNKTGAASLTWSKQSGCSGYIIEYSTDPDFEDIIKTVDIPSAATNKDTSVYVRIKSYKNYTDALDNEVTIESGWSYPGTSD